MPQEGFHTNIGQCWERVNHLSRVAKQQDSDLMAYFASQSCGNDATFLHLIQSFLKTSKPLGCSQT